MERNEKDKPIGSEFEYKGKTYIVVEKIGCLGCDLYDNCCLDLFCSSNRRSDGKTVIAKLKVK